MAKLLDGKKYSSISIQQGINQHYKMIIEHPMLFYDIFWRKDQRTDLLTEQQTYVLWATLRS